MELTKIQGILVIIGWAVFIAGWFMPLENRLIFNLIAIILFMSSLIVGMFNSYSN